MKRSKHPTPKRPPQILFCKQSYSPGIFVDDWQNAFLSEPKDNYVYRDGLSNLVSTYVRLGINKHDDFKTETHLKMAQVYEKTNPIYSFKPLVNFTSYPCTDTPARNKLMKTAELPQLPQDFGVMDYVSTSHDDFRNPCPGVFKPLKIPTQPWLINRVIKSNLTQNYGSVPPAGDYQCLDMHTPIAHVRRMKLFRCKSFNPATSLQEFPNISPESIEDDIPTKNTKIQKY